MVLQSPHTPCCLHDFIIIAQNEDIPHSCWIHSGCRRKPAGTASLYYMGALSAPALTTLCKAYSPGKNVTIQTAVQSPVNYEASSRMRYRQAPCLF